MTSEKLNSAIQLIEAGNRQAAVPVLRAVIQENMKDEEAWLLLSTCMDQVEHKKFCLQSVLAINPANQEARDALTALNQPAAAPVIIPQPEPIQETQTEDDKAAPEKMTQDEPASSGYFWDRVESEKATPEKMTWDEVDEISWKTSDSEKAEPQEMVWNHPDSEKTAPQEMTWDEPEEAEFVWEKADPLNFEREKMAWEQTDSEQLESERTEREKIERKRVEREKAELERVESLKMEWERTESERSEKEKAEPSRLESEKAKSGQDVTPKINWDEWDAVEPANARPPKQTSVKAQSKPVARRKTRKKSFPIISLLIVLALSMMICTIAFVFLAEIGALAPFTAMLSLASPSPSIRPVTPILIATPIPPSATFTETISPSRTPTLTQTATVTLTPTPSEVVEITWFSGFGRGSGVNNGTTDRNDVAVLQSVVDDFNASQRFIHLNLQVVPYTSGPDQFRAGIAAGQAPDILGPMFLSQTNEFHGQWLDLTPYIGSGDLDAYQPVITEISHTSEGQISLPFSVNPSALFYNKKLFDKAGLNYPPAEYGANYEMPDGTQMIWDWDALSNVGRLLTLDNKGLNATQNDFDKQHIVQYGFSWTSAEHPTNIGAYWGRGSMLSDDGRTAHIPDAWHAAWQWTFDGIWGDQPFIPSQKVERSALLKRGDAFGSGKLAMTIQPDWYLPWMSTVKTWDMAAIPSYQGNPGGQVAFYSFFIWKGSKHPREAYIAMSYLLNQGVSKLIDVSLPYGGIPARKDQQQVWVNAKKIRYPDVVNWDVVIAGLDYPDTPSVQSYVPNYDLAWSRGYDFANRIFGVPNLVLSVEENKYLNVLNSLFSTGQ